MFEDKGRKPGEGFIWIADGAVFIGIGIFHQYRAGAIRAQTRAHGPVTFPQTLVITANLWSCRIDPAAAGPGDKTMFAQFACGFCEFGDFENLATEAAFATGFSGDCKHELLASATRFDNPNSVIGKVLAQEESQRAAFFPRDALPPRITLPAAMWFFARSCG
jgi:hypothetical protein